VRSTSASPRGKKSRITPKATNATQDADSPNWGGQGKFKMRLRDLPMNVQAAIGRLKEPSVGASPDGTAIIALSRDVADALRATGPDWQKRAEEALRDKFVHKAA
jgi:uncharacterized protein (DUF4415 family)